MADKYQFLSEASHEKYLIVSFYFDLPIYLSIYLSIQKKNLFW